MAVQIFLHHDLREVMRARLIALAMVLSVAALACDSDTGTPTVTSETDVLAGRPTTETSPSNQSLSTEVIDPTPIAFTPVSVPPTVPSDLQRVETLKDSSIIWELLGLGEIRELPGQLRPDAEPIERDQVVEEWSRFLSNSRVVQSGDRPFFGRGSGRGSEVEQYTREFGDTDLLFCSGGTGLVISVPAAEVKDPVGREFAWSITHSPASQWYHPILNFQMINPTLSFDIPSDIHFGQAGGFDEDVLVLGRGELFILEAASVEEACQDLEGFSSGFEWQAESPNVGGPDISTHE